MGIGTETARLLLASARAGVSFTRSVTIGRQNYFSSHAETSRLLREYGRRPGDYPRLLTGPRGGRYAEVFFEALGARQVESLDASNYEGATIVHDMNQPLPRQWVGQFDAVYDGGTVEHVFNCQVALRNCMELAKVGGHVLMTTPANNYCGHGFYQFSPELFFRLFCPANGFELEWLVAMEDGPRHRFYQVMDPAVIHARGPVINPFPVALYVQARKVGEVPAAWTTPQQSDYRTTWEDRAAQARPADRVAPRRGLRSALEDFLLEHLPRLSRALEAFRFCQLNRQFSFRNRAAFKRLEKTPAGLKPRRG